jgi:hypothetical protein
VLDALAATAHDLAVGIALVSFALIVLSLLVRSGNALKRREQERFQNRPVTHVTEEWLAGDDWDGLPPKWTPAVAESHPRDAERIVPQAGIRRAA